MKLTQKLVSAVLAFVMLTSCISVFAESYRTLYAADGRSKSFPVSKVEAQLKVGWYTEPVTTVYAEDGRTKVIKKADLEAYKKVDWYESPVQRLYRPYQSSKVFYKYQVSDKLKDGWYEEPLQMLYAPGKLEYFPKSQVAAQLKVGWYAEPMLRLYHPEEGSKEFDVVYQVSYQLKNGWYTEPVQRLYTLEKSKVFKKTQVAAQLKVGWYDAPVTKIYAEDGRTKVIKNSDLEAYKKVGWYASPIITMYYPDGRTKKIADIDKKEYEEKGWYSYKVTTVYAPDGREKAVKPSEVEAYEKVGWSRYPFFQIEWKQSEKRSGKYEQKQFYWKYIPGVTNHTVTIIEKRDTRGRNKIAANKPIVIKNVTSNYVYVNTYPNCTYTIKVTGGNSTGERTFKVWSEWDSARINEFENNMPRTHEEMVKAMVNVTVPVWRLVNGKKVSSTATVTVYKGIADPIKKVFNEIYNGKEKFPIKDIGGYQNRPGEHSQGTAVDINSNENYCIYRSGTIVGSHWLPDKDPYSIKPYGDVVRAFEKNGFTWGGDAWSSNIDYMHFSYCGT